MHDEALLRSLAHEGQLVHVERIPARPAVSAEPLLPLAPELRDALGVEHLWSHQARAIDLLRAGYSVAVATGTSSGKSLCYQAAIAESVGEGTARPGRTPSGASTPGTALLMFPTKALAQDQLRALCALGLPALVPSTYDGDTLSSLRPWVRRHANVVLTNPEMLHAGILTGHGRWADFLRRLQVVVVDELHVLRGVFGTHVGHLLRRLRRLCAAYGSSPVFCFSSATIGAPGPLASALCGLPVVEVTEDGSPRGERVLALWNPPLVDARTGVRASAHAETARLTAGLVGSGRRTIAFTRSRRATELVASAVRRQLPDDVAGRVRSYRAGYLPEERREIERELFDGRLAGVVATSALELGIDVGGLDACVVDGFPGTIASFRQQVGRAGHAGRPSMAVLVAGSDQLDQWLARHPDELVRRPPEPAVINPGNPFVLNPHLACAAYEQPLTLADGRWWADNLDDGVRELVLADLLRVRDGRAVWAGRGTPGEGLSLRSGWSGEVRIVDGDGRLVGTVDARRAPELVHPGAVYLHQGQTWQVEVLDLDEREAVVVPSDGDVLTTARTHTDIRVLCDERRASLGRSTAWLGTVEVTTQVIGYERRDTRTGERLGTTALELPPAELTTRAFWYTLDDEVLGDAGLEAAEVPGALHAMEHAAIGLLPLFTICDRWDVGGVSVARHVDTGMQAAVFVYDGWPGGAGVAELGWGAGRVLLQGTLDAIAACGCESGCPSCVQSPKCGNGNDPLSKPGAVALLRTVLSS